ncbi:hypothetical protein [Planctomicrobium sp. SH664]|uniref:hypothetical protein n=1 Tax=Planctomicrobium sp. SH664 TaxID=3448125 RepID=UPI003F5C55BB
MQRSANEGHGVMEWANERVEQQPLESLFAAFTAGFVLGIGAVAAYCASQPQSTRQRLMHQSENLSERIAEAVHKHLPANIANLWRS